MTATPLSTEITRRRVYSNVEHLARTVWREGFDRGKRMALFSAYFDASGTKRKTVLTVAGFVSRVKKWERFDQEWARILGAHGVSFFHMTDFASSEGEFKSWRGETDRRRELITQLLACVKTNTNKGFATSLILEDYRTVNNEYPLMEGAGKPFALCARTCMGMLRKWAIKKNIPIEQILIAIEDGDDDRGDFLERAPIDGMKVIAKQKDSAPAFQAADLVGWKTRTGLHEALKVDTLDGAHSVLRSLSVLDKALSVSGAFDETALRNLCIKGGVPKRGLMNA